MRDSLAGGEESEREPGSFMMNVEIEKRFTAREENKRGHACRFHVKVSKKVRSDALYAFAYY